MLRLLMVAALAGAVLIAVESGARQASAAQTTFNVTTANDENLTTAADTSCVSPNGCSLRAALEAADNLGATTTSIILPAGTYTLDPTLGALEVGAVSGEIVSITGLGSPAVQQSAGCTETPSLNCMVFFLDPNGIGGISVSISGLTIEGGHTANPGGGGGILGGSLTATPDLTTISNSMVTGNTATGGASGGGIAYAHGNLIVSSCVFSANNAVDGSGGGIDLSDGIGGSTLTVTSSTFSGNTAGSPLNGGGGGLHLLGAGSTYTVTGSQFDGNLAPNAAVPGGGGGILKDSGTLTVTGNTFTGNSAGSNGAGGAINTSSDDSNLGSGGTPGLNRFAGNTAKAGRGQSLFRNTGNTGVVTAENNWWGTNAPNTQDAPANVTLTDWIVLGLSASPTFLSQGGAAALTADLSHNNMGASPGLIPLGPVAIGVSWPPATLGTLSGQTSILDTSARATATYTADSVSGTGTASVRVDGQTATLNIPILLPPAISKSFATASVALNASTTLSFSLTNPNSVSGLSGIGFTDNLPAGLVVASPNGLSGSCGAGTITAVAGSNSIGLGGGSIAASGSCTFSVSVTGTSTGTQLNTTSSVSSSEGGSGSSASASIDVMAPPTISKSFSPGSIALNGTSSLSFTISNPGANAVALSGVAFTDQLPAGLTVPNGSAAACGGTLTTVAPGTINLSGGSVASNSTCTFTVVVTGSAGGDYTNTTGPVTSTNGGTGNTASDSLVVASPPVIFKSFGVTTLPLGGTTTLSFLVSNPNNQIGLTGIGFTDNLPAGLIVASPNGLSGSCGGGTIAAVTGASSITLSGASLAAGVGCSFSVDVTATAASVASNSVTVTSTEGGTGNTSSATINVIAQADLVVSKTGPASAVAGDPANLIYTITVVNNGPSDAQAVVLSDALPVGESLVSQSQTCGPAFTLSSSGNTITDGIATLPAGAVACFTVVAHVSPSLAEGTVLSNTAVVGSSTTDPDATNNASTAATLVHAQADLAVSKSGPTSAVAGDPANLTYTIVVANNGPSDAQAVVLSDALPVGEVFVSQSQTCGSAFTLSSSGNTVNDAIATLPAGAVACFTVVAHISPSLAEGTVLSNTAVVGSSTTDPDVRNNSSTTATLVTDARISANGADVSAVEGQSFAGPVATLGDPDPGSTPGEYSAIINWGDGTSSAGTVSGPTGGPFTISGTHAYSDEGSFTATVAITDGDTAANNRTANSRVMVADAALTAGQLTVTGGIERSSATTVAFNFSDANTLSTAGDFIATLSWGDGSSSSGTVTAVSGGSFKVSATHTYSEEGTYPVTVTVNDDGGNTASASGTGTVADAVLTAVCAAPPASRQDFNGATATFADAASPGGTLSDFSATIVWGDGSSSTGTVSGPSGGPYVVSASHHYANTNFFTITTSINDVGGSTASTSCNTLVYGFAPGGGAFVIGDGNGAVGMDVTFWGGQWSKRNSLSGGSAPANFKGFAESPAAPACQLNWSANPGNSTPPPAGTLPTYMAVIVTSSTTTSGSEISGTTVHVVIVKVNPGYAPDPSSPGTGTVVAQLC